jgi:hypothetical protein
MSLSSSPLRWVLSLGLILLTFCFVCAPVQAQSNGDGSPYSRFGLGTLTDFSSSRSQAMGGGAYALRSLNYNPTANPALWSDQVFTRLSAGASFQRTNTTTGNESGVLTSGLVEGIQLSFPLYERTLGVGLSFQPYTQHNYRVQRERTVDPINESYKQNLRGKGGLHSFRAGLGYRINEIVSVGASVDVLFGIIEKERSTEFDDPAFRNASIADATRLNGVTSTVGVQFSFADVLQKDDALSVGTAVALPTNLNGTRVLTTGEGRNLTQDTLESVNGEVSLPLRSRLGVAYQPNSTWTLTLDGLYEPWSTFSSNFASEGTFKGGFPEGGEDIMSDRWRISAGMEVIPGADDPLSGFFANTGYRLGAAIERLYVQPKADPTLRSYTATAGFSFPTSLPGTRIDLNVEAGTRGTTDGSLVRDNFYSVSLHINFGERWFKERKLR